MPFDPIKGLVDTSQWIRKHIASEASPAGSPLLERWARIQTGLDRQIAILDATRLRWFWTN